MCSIDQVQVTFCSKTRINRDPFTEAPRLRYRAIENGANRDARLERGQVLFDSSAQGHVCETAASNEGWRFGEFRIELYRVGTCVGREQTSKSARTRQKAVSCGCRHHTRDRPPNRRDSVVWKREILEFFKKEARIDAVVAGEKAARIAALCVLFFRDARSAGRRRTADSIYASFQMCSHDTHRAIGRLSLSFARPLRLVSVRREPLERATVRP